MEKNNAIQRIYDLIEKFNFDELSAEEKSLVLQHITEAEYRNMRSAVGDTIRFFSGFPEEKIPERKGIVRFINYRIELYKVAALFILLLGAGLILSKEGLRKNQADLLARVDTVYVQHTDTLLIERWDTLEIIREYEVAIDNSVTPHKASPGNIRQPSVPESEICDADICPGDLEDINKLNSRNDISRDSDLKAFMVALN